jgi:CYTH domain-containing protein
MVNLEVERRFLVRGSGWRPLGDGEAYFQGYLNTDADRTVRVRLEGTRGVITIKGRRKGRGRTEVEIEIPAEKAEMILQHQDGLCLGSIVSKVRFKILVGDSQWEVDEFKADNEGLVIAEIEYHGPEDGIEAWAERVDLILPDWVGEEITDEVRYHNSRLAARPFVAWTDEEKAPVLRHGSTDG